MCTPPLPNTNCTYQGYDLSVEIMSTVQLLENFVRIDIEGSERNDPVCCFEISCMQVLIP